MIPSVFGIAVMILLMKRWCCPDNGKSDITYWILAYQSYLKPWKVSGEFLWWSGLRFGFNEHLRCNHALWKLDLYSAPLWEARLWSAQVYGSHSCYAVNSPHLFYLVAFTRWRHQCSDSSHQISAYYSFIDPRRMKGRVGPVSWPYTADGLPI